MFIVLHGSTVQMEWNDTMQSEWQIVTRVVLYKKPYENRNKQHPGQRVTLEQLERKIGGQN